MNADGLTDLWVDGRVYRVPREVAAHVKWLGDLNASLAHKAAQFADRLRTLGVSVLLTAPPERPE